MTYQIQQETLSRDAAKSSLRHVLIPKLTYPLIATNLTEQHCHSILRSAMNQALPALGINFNFLCAVALGPVGHQGLKIPDLFTKQLALHLLTMIQQRTQSNDLTG